MGVDTEKFLLHTVTNMDAKLDDVIKVIARIEGSSLEKRVEMLEHDVDLLKSLKDISDGEKKNRMEYKNDNRWNMTACIATGGFLVTLLGFVGKIKGWW